jgi:hypothetical protein
VDPFVENRVIVVSGGYTEVALQLTCEKSVLGNSVYVKYKQQPENNIMVLKHVMTFLKIIISYFYKLLCK